MKGIKPYAHQIEAIEAIKKELSFADRTNVQMACGTGKTKTCIWVAEHLDFKKIIIFVPTLSLISQYIKEWEETYTKKYKSIIICSDKTVKKINIDYEVTTKSEQIKKLLNEKYVNSVVVFCTYNSVKTLSSSMPENFCFDFGIFDEAHKTTGISEYKAYSEGLHNDKVKIKKRLFVTATPIFKRMNKNNKNYDINTVYSMDDISLYGKCCYSLSFNEAIEKNLICDFKIIIGVHDAETEEILEKDKIKALAEAINISNANKILTYHKSIDSALNYLSYIEESYELTYFETHHINGNMPIKERKKIFDSFESEDKSIITNAKCLTEGIDIPKIDMVAFLEPRYSIIEIIQAVGRCVRLYKGKQFGYVFVPLFINQHETFEESQSEFKRVIEIIRYIKYFSICISDKINRKQNYLKEDDIIVIGSNTTGYTKDKNIKAFILEEFSDSWSDRFNELKALIEAYGPNEYRKYQSNKLRQWCVDQRKFIKNGTILIDRQEKLESIAFDIDVPRKIYIDIINRLINFLSKNNNKYDKLFVHDRSLYRWCLGQQKAKQENKILDWKLKMLNEINFPFGTLGKKSIKDSQKNVIRKMKKYFDKKGHFYPHQNERPVYDMCNRYREKNKKNKLKPELKNMLIKIGFTFESKDEYMKKNNLETLP